MPCILDLTHHLAINSPIFVVIERISAFFIKKFDFVQNLALFFDTYDRSSTAKGNIALSERLQHKNEGLTERDFAHFSHF